MKAYVPLLCLTISTAPCFAQTKAVSAIIDSAGKETIRTIVDSARNDDADAE